jgi:hypothetical protein
LALATKDVSYAQSSIDTITKLINIKSYKEVLFTHNLLSLLIHFGNEALSAKLENVFVFISAQSLTTISYSVFGLLHHENDIISDIACAICSKLIDNFPQFVVR